MTGQQILCRNIFSISLIIHSDFQQHTFSHFLREQDDGNIHFPFRRFGYIHCQLRIRSSSFFSNRLSGIHIKCTFQLQTFQMYSHIIQCSTILCCETKNDFSHPMCKIKCYGRIRIYFGSLCEKEVNLRLFIGRLVRSAYFLCYHSFFSRQSTVLSLIRIIRRQCVCAITLQTDIVIHRTFVHNTECIAIVFTILNIDISIDCITTRRSVHSDSDTVVSSPV